VFTPNWTEISEAARTYRSAREEADKKAYAAREAKIQKIYDSVLLGFSERVGTAVYCKEKVLLLICWNPHQYDEDSQLNTEAASRILSYFMTLDIPCHIDHDPNSKRSSLYIKDISALIAVADKRAFRPPREDCGDSPL
jgi:hypothetical protein